MHEYAQQCSMKIHANLIVLQEEMTKKSNSNMDESAFVALAGLKQVKLLKYNSLTLMLSKLKLIKLFSLKGKRSSPSII